MTGSQQTPSGKLSELARHVVVPSGIVSTGWPAVRDKAKQAGILFDPWQDGLGRLILAKRKNGLYAAGIAGVLISICRQVGKTFTIGSMIFMLCIIFPGTKALWTAHRARTSDETFKSMQGLAKRRKIAPHVRAVRQANGQQEVEFHNGSRILFGARESGFGRGFDAVDILVFDEAQILTEKALDDMVPATNVSPNPLILMMGTPPKPTDPAEVFISRRREALAGEVDDMAYVEFSADPDADPNDRAQWRKGNPSYPSRTPEAAMLRMKRILGDESFRREGMGIWDDDSEGSEFPAGVWSGAATKLNGPLRNPIVAVDVRMGVQQALSLGVVGDTDDGPVAMVARFEERRGAQWTDEQIVGWVVEELKSRDLHRIAIDGYGENGPLIPLLEEADMDVVKFNTVDMRNACMSFHSGVLNGQVRHLAEKPLDTAVAGARRRISNDGWRWSRQDSKTNIGPLLAVAEAWWIYTTEPDYDLMDSFG
jgi:phage terminase large subunit-like protein